MMSPPPNTLGHSSNAQYMYTGKILERSVPIAVGEPRWPHRRCRPAGRGRPSSPFGGLDRNISPHDHGRSHEKITRAGPSQQDKHRRTILSKLLHEEASYEPPPMKDGSAGVGPQNFGSKTPPPAKTPPRTRSTARKLMVQINSRLVQPLEGRRILRSRHVWNHGRGAHGKRTLTRKSDGMGML